MGLLREPRREAGGVPIDLALALMVTAVVVALAIWFTVATGSAAWLLLVAAAIVAAYFVLRPTRRRRRVDADGRHRQVGHDGSWTKGREEE